MVSSVHDKSILGWIIKDSNDIVKMATDKYIGKTLIIMVECMTLRDDMLVQSIRDFWN